MNHLFEMPKPNWDVRIKHISTNKTSHTIEMDGVITNMTVEYYADTTFTGPLKLKPEVTYTGSGRLQLRIDTALGPINWEFDLNTKQMKYFTDGKELNIRLKVLPMEYTVESQEGKKKNKK